MSKANRDLDMYRAQIPELLKGIVATAKKKNPRLNSTGVKGVLVKLISPTATDDEKAVMRRNLERNWRRWTQNEYKNDASKKEVVLPSLKVLLAIYNSAKGQEWITQYPEESQFHNLVNFLDGKYDDEIETLIQINARQLTKLENRFKYAQKRLDDFRSYIKENEIG